MEFKVTMPRKSYEMSHAYKLGREEISRVPQKVMRISGDGFPGTGEFLDINSGMSPLCLVVSWSG